jgi:Anti-sigma-K factor rskA
VSERGPDFDELVGPVDEPGLEPVERERLRHVHELLIAAGPPPELSTRLETPPRQAGARMRPRRPLRVVAIAAAFGVLAFGVGYLAGGGPDYETFDHVAMTGTAAAAGAQATIEVFDVDPAGNWPMEIKVTGLKPPASGKPYELWLTHDGKRLALCGSFLADPDGATRVPMNAPFRLRDYDGWIVVEHGSNVPLLTT